MTGRIPALAVRALASAFALAVLSALVVGSASADEWLVNGSSIFEPMSMSMEGEMEVIDLTTPTGEFGVLCGGVLMGAIQTEGKGEFTEVLNLSGVKIEELSNKEEEKPGLKCTSTKGCEGTDIEMWPVHLPWRTQIVLMTSEPEFLTHIFGSEERFHPGYEVLCLILGFAVLDLCEASVTGELKNMIEPETVLGIFSPASPILTEKGSCTLGGAESLDITAEATNVLIEGLTLSVS